MNKNETSCYVSWTYSKTGDAIPCYENGKASASLYSPQKEAEGIANSEAFKNAGFILTAGIGSAHYLNELKKRFPDAFIAVVEANKASADFVLRDSKVLLHKDIAVCTANELYDFLLQHYLLPLHGNFCFFPLRSWADANKQLAEHIKQTVSRALKTVSEDVSVQAHFGKIWHKNILQNLELFSQAQKQQRALDFYTADFPVHKTAFVAAAGPGLQACFDVLKSERNSYYIIATDTAYRALNAHNIISDAVVSVDPQHISVNHIHTHISNQTLFICDLCCNTALVRAAFCAGSPLLFFNAGHPLCSLAELWYKTYSAPDTCATQTVGEQTMPAQTSCTPENKLFPVFNASSGTVTLAALDFAVQAGFKRIIVGGADFAYTDGKAYTTGSYFDALFGMQSTRFNTFEKQFCSLMFRTEVELIDEHCAEKGYTTQLLKRYAHAFNELCRRFPYIERFEHIATDKHNAADTSEKKDRFIQAQSSTANTAGTCRLSKCFDEQKFGQWYVSRLQNLAEQQNSLQTQHSGSASATDKAVLASLLPYSAWLKRTQNFHTLTAHTAKLLAAFVRLHLQSV